MKQIIPFKKELLFKTKVSEITSISLEHNLSLTSDDLISGEFIITGDYKMTDASINREKFEFNLPFDIALDSRYDSKNLVIDIDNFYYEVINNEFLTVNIDVYVEGDKIIEEKDVDKEIVKIKEEDKEEIDDDPPIITMIPPKEVDTPLIKPIELPKNDVKEIKENIDNKKSREVIEDRETFLDMNIDYQKPKIIDLNVSEDNYKNDNFNIFENIDNSDTYITYHVYIVKETDTIETIMEKYKVKKESLSLYNDIENIKPGAKLIIPYE